MSIFFRKFYETLTVSGSAGTFDTTGTPVRGTLLHLVVRSATASTVFDFALRDKDLGFVIWQRSSVTQEINEDIGIPVQGNYELIISNSTADEDFRLYMAIREI